MNNMPDFLNEFINEISWVFAITYADTWPHEYIVRDKVDESNFIELVTHIRTHGFPEMFYSETYTYFAHENMVYWTMEGSIDETIIINRCRKDQTYSYRLAQNTLP